VACHHLIAHPILVAPETLLAKDSETLKVAKAARSTCQKSVWNQTEKAQFLVNQGRAIARAGDREGANTKFQQAQKLAPNINIPTSEQLAWWVAEGLVNKGEKQAREGKLKEALATYREAQTIEPTWKISAESWNTLCWNGSLHEQAAAVMQACEKAVALEPKNGELRDSRGVARALTGDQQGAMDDFQAFIEWDNMNLQQTYEDRYEKRKQREGWINTLKAGRNPCTQEEIEKLKR